MMLYILYRRRLRTFVFIGELHPSQTQQLNAVNHTLWLRASPMTTTYISNKIENCTCDTPRKVDLLVWAISNWTCFHIWLMVGADFYWRSLVAAATATFICCDFYFFFTYRAQIQMWLVVYGVCLIGMGFALAMICGGFSTVEYCQFAERTQSGLWAVEVTITGWVHLCGFCVFFLCSGDLWIPN